MSDRLTLGTAVAAAVGAMLTERSDITVSEARAALPTHILAGKPSTKSIAKAIVSAGWIGFATRDGGTVYRAPGTMADELGDNGAAERLRLLIERVERIEEEQRGLADDKRDVFAEAKGDGYDPKAMRAVIKLRRMEKHARDEADATLELYRSVLGMT